MAQSQRARRPALITCNEVARWESCRVIGPNLLRVYKDYFAKSGFDLFLYTHSLYNAAMTFRGAAVMDLARAIQAADPDRLVFIDHSPHPLPLLRALKIVYGLRELPPIYFHIYGDFLLNAPAWEACDGILRCGRALFLCASGRQAQMVGRLFGHPIKSIEVCPFPVETSRYQFVPQLRKQWREHLGLRDEDFALIYSGRMSLQKNVVQLVRWVSQFFKATAIPGKLILAGDFDDLGSPLFGIRDLLGAGFARFHETLNSLPPAERERIIFVGHKNSEELRGLYNAADCYVSLSLHHDEDFGMAPAEALCCGTSAVLTSWGGFGSFPSAIAGDCDLVSVRTVPGKGLEIHAPDFYKALFLHATTPRVDNARQSRAERYADRFSFEATVEVLRGAHNKPLERFQGFNEMFSKVAARMQMSSPYKKADHGGENFYEYIYQSYLGSSGVDRPQAFGENQIIPEGAEI